MDARLKTRFLDLWSRYFNGAEPPLTLMYAQERMNTEGVKTPSGHQCLVGVLSRVRKGKDISFDAQSVGCFGGKRYLGFSTGLSPNFDHPGPNGVFAPFCAGCASIVMYPWMEQNAETPRAVLGMFDVSPGLSCPTPRCLLPCP
jgi:hypothetical protein